MEAKLNYHPFLKYKVTIPEDFPVTTISGVLYITTSERLILTARTREGKSLLSLYAACKVKEDNPDTIVLIISPNLTANVDDYVGKMNYFEAIKATGVDLKTYKKNKKELTFEFAGIPIQNNIYVVNCDYRYIDELVELCSHSSKQIFMVVDEALGTTDAYFANKATKRFDDFDLATNVDRPCGPGIMYETVIFMAAHLGVKKIIAVGWDLSQTNPKKPNEYEHFYKNEKMLIKGDILPWEVAATCEASKEL